MIRFQVIIDTTFKEIASQTADFKKSIYEQEAFYEYEIEKIREELEMTLTRDKKLVLNKFDNLETIPEKYITVLTKPEDARISRDDFFSYQYINSRNIPVEIECEFDDRKFANDIRRNRRNERRATV